MKKTGLEIVEMIAKGEVPEKIKSKDKSIYIWNSYYSRYDLEKDNNVSLVLLDCLNDEFEIIEEDKVWEPKKDEKYYFINEFNEIDWRIWSDSLNGNCRYELGNCFRTEEEAKKALEKIKIYVRLKRYAEEHNTEKIDWYSGKIFYYIYFDSYGEEIEVGGIDYNQNIGLIYFTSDKLCKQAIKEIGEDNIKKLFEE